jgi:prepilin-type N-terminal cleavage/methylation domain-containing protein
MKNFGKQYRGSHIRSHGFSMIELLAVMAVILVVSAVSTPSFIRAYQYYQVSDAAARMVNVIKYTRYEAIRRNVPVNYVIAPRAPAGTTVWTDSNGDGVADNTERQMIFSGTVNLLAPGNLPAGAVPNLVVAANVGPLIPLSNTAAVVQFDQRGAVNPPPAGAMVSFVGYPGVVGQGAGYRAVILLPSGSMQLWKADISGTWILVH